jgi:hypothetical protein
MYINKNSVSTDCLNNFIATTKLKTGWAALLVACVLTVSVQAQDADAKVSLTELLRKPVEAEFVEAPLKDCCEYLAEKTKLAIILDTRAMEAAGIDSAAPRSLKVSSVPLYLTLDLLLPEGLTYRAQGEVLVITDENSAAAKATSKVYDVSKLVPADELAVPIRGSLEELRDVVQVMVDPENWEDFGGVGSILIWKNQLVIRQTTANHLRIQMLLERIAAALSTEPKAGALSLAEPLSSKLVSVDFVEAPLTDVVPFLADASKTEILIDTESLEESGIDLSSPLTMRQKQVPLRNVLSNLPDGVSYSEVDGVLVLHSESELYKYDVEKIFDTRTLLSAKQDGEAAEFEPAELVDLVTYLIAPDTWDVVGGDGFAYLYRDMLLICGQSPQVHAQIDALLTKLESGGDALTPAAIGDKLLSVEFTETSLQDVVAFLSDSSGIQVRAESDLEEVEVTLSLNKAPARDLFQLLADQAECEWWIEGTTVKFGKEPPYQARVYSMPSILGADFRPSEVANLVDVVESVNPEEWDSYGGMASAWAAGKYLCISQNPSSHRQVLELLSSLAEANKTRTEE